MNEIEAGSLELGRQIEDAKEALFAEMKKRRDLEEGLAAEIEKQKELRGRG